MKNKVLIKLIVPELDNSFDVFIPTNELVWKVKKMVLKSISDLTGCNLNNGREYVLINKYTNQIYLNNVTIYNSDIRNASELILMSVKNYN